MKDVPLEVAISLVRRLLPEGQPLPRTLPITRPLNNMPDCYRYVAEPDRLTHNNDHDMDDDNDLLLNEGRDTTEEENARLLSWGNTSWPAPL